MSEKRKGQPPNPAPAPAPRPKGEPMPGYMERMRAATDVKGDPMPAKELTVRVKIDASELDDALEHHDSAVSRALEAIETLRGDLTEHILHETTYHSQADVEEAIETLQGCESAHNGRIGELEGRVGNLGKWLGMVEPSVNDGLTIFARLDALESESVNLDRRANLHLSKLTELGCWTHPTPPERLDALEAALAPSDEMREWLAKSVGFGLNLESTYAKWAREKAEPEPPPGPANEEVTKGSAVREKAQPERPQPPAPKDTRDGQMPDPSVRAPGPMEFHERREQRTRCERCRRKFRWIVTVDGLHFCGECLARLKAALGVGG